jgi:hypothetical protein
MANLVDLYVVYRILRRLTQPFTDWQAFKLGVIDADGKILKKPQDRRTQAEQESLTTFDVLIMNLKKLIQQLPLGKTKIASYAAALLLIKEEKELTPENLEERFNAYLNSDTLLTEEIANNVGSGNIAGTTGDPPRGSKVMMRRFAGNDVFVVGQDKYKNARVGKKKYLKYESYVGSDETGEAIRQYGRKYPNKPIILQCEKTGEMTFLRYGKKGMFREQFEYQLNEEVSSSQLKDLETYLDKLFDVLGIDISFTRHFLDRVNDPRNGKPITTDELQLLFRKAIQKYGKKIPALGPDAEAVLNDMQSQINLPFVLKWDSQNQELDLVAKTVMRKKNFMTTNQKLTV